MGVVEVSIADVVEVFAEEFNTLANISISEDEDDGCSCTPSTPTGTWSWSLFFCSTLFFLLDVAGLLGFISESSDVVEVNSEEGGFSSWRRRRRRFPGSWSRRISFPAGIVGLV